MSIRFSIPITLRSLGRGFHIVPESETEREPSEVPPPIDYAPLGDAARQVAMWLIDVARSRTSDQLDHIAIDRVQRALTIAFATNAPARVRPDISEEDLLTVAGILITAFEDDLRVPGLGDAAGSIYDATDGDAEALRSLLIAALAERATAATMAHGSSKRRVVGVVPVFVRRRPRVVDDAALADVASTR